MFLAVQLLQVVLHCTGTVPKRACPKEHDDGPTARVLVGEYDREASAHPVRQLFQDALIPGDEGAAACATVHVFCREVVRVADVHDTTHVVVHVLRPKLLVDATVWAGNDHMPHLPRHPVEESLGEVVRQGRFGVVVHRGWVPPVHQIGRHVSLGNEE